MSSRTPQSQHPSEKTSPSQADEKTQSAQYDEHARLFYERLEQRGQLIDVDANTDLATLSPRVTHVRYPDGRIERIGFSTTSRIG